MTYFEAYLLTRLDIIHIFLNALIALISVAGTIIVIAFSNLRIDRLLNKIGESDLTKKQNSLLRHLKFAALILSIAAILKILIPTSKEVALIYIGPAIINNQDVQETVKKLPAISNLGLEYISDIMKKEIEDKVKEY